MAIVITLTQPGQAPVDVTEYADLRTMSIGGKAANGERTTMSIRFYETIANLVSFSAHYILKVTETATTPDTTLASGRCTGWQLARGAGRRGDGDIFQTGNFEDANRELLGLAFAPSEGGADADGQWVRPEETDVARVLALASDFLNGSPRATTVISTATYVPNTNTVTMEAKTYPAGTQPMDVMNDCASAAGKMWWVDADYGLHFDTRGSTNYTAGLSISDRENEVNNTTVFEPWWVQGDAIDFRGENVASGMVAVYAQERAAFYEDAALEAQFDYWIANANVSETDTEAEALLKATAMTEARGRGERTYYVTLRLLDSQVDLVKYGQRVSIKARATDLPSVADYRRIAELKWEYEGYGSYLAHLYLDYPTRIVPLNPGAPPGPKPAQPCTGATVVSSDLEVGVSPADISPVVTAANQLMLAAYFSDCATMPNATVVYSPGGSPAPPDEDLSLVGTFHSGGHVMYLFALWDPTIGGAGHKLTFTRGAGSTGCPGVVREGWYGVVVSGYTSDPTASITVEGAHQTSGTTISDTLASGGNDQIISFVYAATNCTFTATGTDHTELVEATENDKAIAAIGQQGGGNGATGWSWTTGGAGNNHATLGLANLPCTGSTTQPIGGSGEGTVGDPDGTYVGPNHVHEHGDLSDHPTETMHHASSVEITDTGAYYTGTDVEAALQEIGADLSGGLVTDHGVLTGLGDFDHDQYLRATHGGRAVINVVAASGATETLDLADGNVHDVTLTANCTLTLTGATAGVGCDMAILLRQGTGAPWTVTWPGSVEWIGGVAPTLETAEDAWNWVHLRTLDGGTTWFGDGGASSVSALDDLSDVTITSPANGQFLRYNGSAWVNATPSFVGELLISDSPSTPLVFADLLQNEAQDDLLYADT